MRQIEKHLVGIKKIYDRGGSPFDEIRDTVSYCLGKLKNEAGARPLVDLHGKKYWVATYGGSKLSRPYLPAMHISDEGKFKLEWKRLEAAIDGQNNRISLPAKDINSVVYTAINSFCLCYDLWKPGSRKTPGTFLEVLLGTLIGSALPSHERTKFIPLPGQAESVSTDIVFTPRGGGSGIVFPAKITTRERIVQPFAHQRILDSVFGVGTYKSVLLCVSEMQRDEETNANEICVPGTIRLFQSHLSSLSGIYYLDPPTRYLQPDVTAVIPVGSVGSLLASRLVDLT